MSLKRIVLGCAFSAALVAGGVAVAQHPPVDNVSGHRHPNIAAAQRLLDQAYSRIAAAQQANEFDMAGHAARAKDLLDQANRELKASAETANHR